MSLEPLYLERGDRKLFAAYHPPPSRSRETAILVCPPTGQEYDFSYLAIVELATRLNADGFPVMRFDYLGTGDSSGDYDSWSIETWSADVSTAVQDLRARSGRKRICLLGPRLGGTLAYLHAVHQADVDALVLWTPVKNGAAYLRELQRRHKLWLRRVTIRPEPLPEGLADVDCERLGYLLSQKFVDEVGNIDLALLDPPATERILLLDGLLRSSVERALARRLEERAQSVTVETADDPSFWYAQGAVVPHADLETIRAWVGESCP